MSRHTRKGSKSRKIHKRKTQKRTIRKSKMSQKSQKSKSKRSQKSKGKVLKGGNNIDELTLASYLNSNIKKSNDILGKYTKFSNTFNDYSATCSSQVLGTKPPPDKCKKITSDIQVTKKNLSKTFVGLIVSLLLNKAKDIAKLYKKKKHLSALPQFIVDLKEYTKYFIEKEPNSSTLKYNNLVGGIGLSSDGFTGESKTLFDYFENDINNKKSTSEICRNDSICITNIDKIKKINETLYKNMKPEIYFSYAVELIGILKEFLSKK